MRSKFRNPLLYIVGVSMLLSFAMAQTSGLNVTSSNGFSDQLVTAEGMSIYILTQDSDGVSTCTDEVCTTNWQPLTAEGELTLNERVDSNLMGTHERADGTIQLTYAGQPLYTNARDTMIGDSHGQSLGNLFFVLSSTGDAIAGYAAPEVAEVSEEVMAELMTSGEQVYAQHCLACHGAEGQGAVGPQLAGNSNLTRTSFLSSRIINGYPEHGMPAYRDILNDEQVAAVATFVRNSFDNEAGPVIPEEAAEAR